MKSMKKTYDSPRMDMIHIEPHRLLAESMKSEIIQKDAEEDGM